MSRRRTGGTRKLSKNSWSNCKNSVLLHLLMGIIFLVGVALLVAGVVGNAKATYEWSSQGLVYTGTRYEENEGMMIAGGIMIAIGFFGGIGTLIKLMAKGCWKWALGFVLLGMI